MAAGVLFLLPLTATVLLMLEVYKFIMDTVLPMFGNQRPDVFIFQDDVLALIILLTVMYSGGKIVQSKSGRKMVVLFEDNFLIYIPGYSLIKTVVSGAAGVTGDHTLVPVIVQEDRFFLTGYLVEEHEEWCTVMIIEAPRLDCAEVYVVPTADVRKLNIPAHSFGRMIRNYGRGLVPRLKMDNIDMKG
jgi:uncharacterized membrane protein